MNLSKDQKDCLFLLTRYFGAAGIDIKNYSYDVSSNKSDFNSSDSVVILGQAGSGKTELLRLIVKLAEKASLKSTHLDYENKLKAGSRYYTVLAPTNKAVSVLRGLGIPATTLHRVIYSPIYDVEFEVLSAWLNGKKPKPDLKKFDSKTLDEIKIVFLESASIPAALASKSFKTSDFISGWEKRKTPLDIGLVDESSMLSDLQVRDLKSIFKSLILFGDPFQLSPIGQLGRMSFDKIPSSNKFFLTNAHRQVENSPIIRLANELKKPNVSFDDFDRSIKKLAESDSRIIVSSGVDSNLMAKSPVLVWRNQTRIRLIRAFRKVHDFPENKLMKGEPLICEGIELPAKHRKQRLELEERGLIKGAQAVFLENLNQSGFCKLHLNGVSDSVIVVSAIIQLENTNKSPPDIVSAAKMGVLFVHGAATTIHKAQGSQWKEVQIFSPDLAASARSGLIESGVPLWKRLAYVAITRAQESVRWVTSYKVTIPKGI